MRQPSTMEMTPELAQCIRDCSDCTHICQDTIRYCLQMGGPHVEAWHRSLGRAPHWAPKASPTPPPLAGANKGLFD